MSAISAGKLYVGKLAPNNSAPIHGLMQHSPLQLRQKLIDTVDDKYNVKDMAAIVEVLGILERLPVTKEVLESTRLGKTVNEFRKKVNNDYLAKRAKALVKKWRETILLPEDSSHSSQQAQPQQTQPSRSHNGKAKFNVDKLLREQIAEAHREGHGRTTDEIVREIEERSVQEKLEAAAKSVASTPSSSSKKMKAVQDKYRRLQEESAAVAANQSSSPLTTTGPVVAASKKLLGEEELKTNNEFVQNYLKSQSELKQQMEQQYLDTLSRSEFQESTSNHHHHRLHHHEGSESIPEYPASETTKPSKSKRKSKKGKFVDVSLSSMYSSSSASNSPAVPPLLLTTTTTVTTTSSQQPPLTSPQSSFSSNNSKFSSKSKLINNYTEDEDVEEEEGEHVRNLLSEERDEIEPYYNNNNNNRSSTTNINNNLVSSGTFLTEFNDQNSSEGFDEEGGARTGGRRQAAGAVKYLNSSDRFRSSSSSPLSTAVGLRLGEEEDEVGVIEDDEEESSKSPPLSNHRPEVASPSPSSSTSASTSTVQSTSRKKRKRPHPPDEDYSEPNSPHQYDLIASATLADGEEQDNKRPAFLFDEESQMECDTVPTKSTRKTTISSVVGLDFSSFLTSSTTTTKLEQLEQSEEGEPVDDDYAESESGPLSLKSRAIDVETLHAEQLPNINGNVDPSGQFHEWHETYSVPSVSGGEPLHILPYCIIDF